jgi:hypothetical protein
MEDIVDGFLFSKNKGIQRKMLRVELAAFFLYNKQNYIST